MSNCIDIINPVLKFPPQTIILGPTLRRIKDLKFAPEDPNDHIAWWFLTNSTIEPGGRTTINLGFGRSRHTYRDFRATLLCLDRLMIPGKRVKRVFTIMDAENPDSPWEKFPWVFAKED